MSKTLTNITVQQPQVFDAKALKALQDSRVESYLKSPVSKHKITEFTFFEFLQTYDRLVAEGYTRCRDSDAFLWSSPFVCYMKKPEKLLKAELQKIKDDTEVEYKDRIAASVEASRKALVAQRIAFFEAEEKKKEEERKAALLAELEAEAADLFKHSV